MTREEAIQWLIDEKYDYMSKLGTDTEAYDVAIRALHEPEIIRCENCKHFKLIHKWTDCGKCEMFDGSEYNWVRPNDFCCRAERLEDEQ